jgi:hypothetical protein
MTDTHLKYLLEISINGALYDIANVIHYLFKGEYVSARLKNKLWFKYDGLKWKQIEEGPYYELSTTILSHYGDYLKELLLCEIEHQTLLVTELFENESELELVQKNLKRIQNDITKTNLIIDKLKNVNFKESICKECLYLFYDPEFISKLDIQEYLVCFKNIIYDIRTKQIKVPEKMDMISIFIEYEFKEPVSCEDIENFNDLLSKFKAFRKNLLKKRHPKNVYNLYTF